jgi:hypothetical protein
MLVDRLWGMSSVVIVGSARRNHLHLHSSLSSYSPHTCCNSVQALFFLLTPLVLIRKTRGKENESALRASEDRKSRPLTKDAEM